MKKEFIFRLLLVLCIAIGTYQFGIKSFTKSEVKTSTEKRINNWAVKELTREQGIYDVIVVGEEPEGIAAAVSASRAGANTLLISEGSELGGVITSSLYSHLEVNYTQNGNLLNRGFFSELYEKLGADFSPNKYKTVVNNILKETKNLTVVYNAVLGKPAIKDGKIESLEITADGKSVLYNGKRFIDATRDGKVLEMCGVPYFSGSEDLNLKKSFAPVKLNFVMENINWGEYENTSVILGSKALEAIFKYEFTHINMKLSDFKIIKEDDNKAIVRGIEVFGVDIKDKKAAAIAYTEAVEEAKGLTAFLSTKFEAFKDAKFSKAAGSFYIPENRHFAGDYILKVNDILENKDFEDRIAVGSEPLETSKFTARGEKYFIGKPLQYSIPLGCIIPQKVDNLLMVGSKISYSSLASSSAANTGVNIATGESAGIVAVYSLAKNKTPRQLLKDTNKLEDIQNLLKNQGMYFPGLAEQSDQSKLNWSYSALKKLLGLGLVAGGLNNDYKYESIATQEDLSIMLINGIFRIYPEKYTIELDSRVRPYFIKDKLSKEKIGEILMGLYDQTYKKGTAYTRACELGYIDDVAILRLKDKENITMDLVYYISLQNIRQYTGKEVPE